MHIVLSGGGARGFAHVGALQALYEHGYHPNAVAATSAGALVGALIADGYHPAEIKEMTLKTLHIGYLFDVRKAPSKFITLQKIGDFLGKQLRRQHLEELPLPFYPCATNYLNGEQHIFRQGPIVPAVLAACSIPVLFDPVTIDGIPYVDGGLSNNLPTEPFAEQKANIVAVNVNPIGPYHPKSSMARSIDRAIHLSFQRQIQQSAKDCLLYIEPHALHQFGLFELNKLADIYQAGYEGAQEAIFAQKNT